MTPSEPRPGTQAARLLAFLRSNPGASSLEITHALSIVNVTGRVSDLRAYPGIDVDCRKRKDGRDGYWLRENDGTLFGRAVA